MKSTAEELARNLELTHLAVVTTVASNESQLRVLFANTPTHQEGYEALYEILHSLDAYVEASKEMVIIN